MKETHKETRLKEEKIHGSLQNHKPSESAKKAFKHVPYIISPRQTDYIPKPPDIRRRDKKGISL